MNIVRQFSAACPGRRAGLVCGLVLVQAVSLHGAPPAAGAAVSYSARAVAFRVDGVTDPVNGPIVIGDTGALPAAGGLVERHAADVSLYGGALTVDTVDAVAAGGGGEAAADANLGGYQVHFVTQDGADIFIAADFISASASAALNPGGKASTSARVVVQGLKVNGKPIAVTGAPNQVIELVDDEVRLVINEQVSRTAKGSGDIAVAAIHFYICECMEGHFGLVSAGISGTGAPPREHDCGKVTGGGWITGTPAGAKGTFGVSGGIRRGEFWGHLTYVDHGSGLKVQSTAVTGFEVDPADANARIIVYAVSINGAAGTARVRVADYGEPGRNDTFSITLSNGYTAAGDLGGSRPGETPSRARARRVGIKHAGSAHDEESRRRLRRDFRPHSQLGARIFPSGFRVEAAEFWLRHVRHRRRHCSRVL